MLPGVTRVLKLRGSRILGKDVALYDLITVITSQGHAICSLCSPTVVVHDNISDSKIIGEIESEDSPKAI